MSLHVVEILKIILSKTLFFFWDGECSEFLHTILDPLFRLYTYCICISILFLMHCKICLKIPHFLQWFIWLWKYVHGIIACIVSIIDLLYVKFYRQCLEECVSQHSEISETANQKLSFIGRQIHFLLENSITGKGVSLQRT